MPALRAAYADLVSRGEVRPDPAQEAALESLARLQTELKSTRPSLFRKPAAPRGVYLWGPVGRGKSMLMDLFFETAPADRKRRVHFQTFMAETHRRIGIWRRGDPAERKSVFGQAKGDDPIPPVAELIARQARLLCFDELQVTDITDAMLLGRLFEALFARGVTLVATSNRPPDDLYKDGINRELFIPFIHLIKARLEIVALKGPTDFRLDRLRGARTYLSPVTPANDAAFEALWRELTDGADEIGATLVVLGRKLMFPRATGGFLHTSFASLCGQALGSQDYLAIAERFHTVFLENVPVLSAQRRDEARRFVHLIDALYEADAKLVILAEAEPDRLYPEGEGSFEFQRTASRLHEMRSLEYLERARG